MYPLNPSRVLVYEAREVESENCKESSLFDILCGQINDPTTKGQEKKHLAEN